MHLNRNLKTRILIVILLAVIRPSVGIPQGFIEGMILFNQARYDSLIQFVPEFVRQHPDREGVARYFLAESYYNKAIASDDAEASVVLFRRAAGEFRSASERHDLKSNAEYYHFSNYKIGWCFYRLAELAVSPLENLLTAHAEFIDLKPAAPDSIRLFSYFMAAKSMTRANLLRIYSWPNAARQPEELTNILGAYKEVEAAYDQILNATSSRSSPARLTELKAFAATEKASISYHLGKWQQVLSAATVSQDAVAGEPRRLVETALSHFGHSDYASIPDYSPMFERQGLVISHLTTLNLLNQYMLTGEENLRETLEEHLTAAGLTADVMFRRANLFHSHPDVTSDDFNELANRAYEAASSIPESVYWLGFLQMIQGDHRGSRASFVKYIEDFDRDRTPIDRTRILYEDAQFRRYLLDFELNYLSSNFRNLRALAEVIKAFSPTSAVIQNRKEQLNLLVRCGLANNVTQLRKVLTGSDDEELNQAFGTIKFILPRAALTIGRTREKYITLLDRLLEITDLQRSDETRFFRGIVRTLEAEIQPNPVEKAKAFKEAAKTLNSISSGYSNKDEADYLRANCLFFADELDEAERLLTRLVNQKKYLRALFYLAEIYRLSGRGLAAKKCYDVIIDHFKTSTDEFDRYWLLNAQAGLTASENDGSLEVLGGLNIHGVEFQPNLDRNRLTYEKLADESYLQQRSSRESVNWLAHYGWPKKEIYPSKHRTPASTFVAENIFENFPAVLDEIRGPITSSLELTVVLPDGIGSQCEVILADEKLARLGNVYSKKSIALNSVLELTVTGEGLFPVRRTLHFSKSGTNREVVILDKTLAFSTVKRDQNVLDNANYVFKPRWDQNYVFSGIAKQGQQSELVRDFSAGYQLRDCVLDEANNRILAVNSSQNSIWIYSHELSSKKIGEFELTRKLNSPEGIDVDWHGNIFVADWGNHRVVQFSKSGEFVKQFGSDGGSRPAETGRTTRFVFPTRVAVLEDKLGVEIDDATYYRQKYLFVADQNGVHVCDANGEFLSTLLSPTEQLPRGSFYGFTVDGYGDDTVIRLIDRNAKTTGQVVEFVAN